MDGPGTITVRYQRTTRVASLFPSSGERNSVLDHRPQQTFRIWCSIKLKIEFFITQLQNLYFLSASARMNNITKTITESTVASSISAPG